MGPRSSRRAPTLAARLRCAATSRPKVTSRPARSPISRRIRRTTRRSTPRSISSAASKRTRLTRQIPRRRSRTRARSAPIESGGFSWGQGWESLSALIRFWGAGRPKAYCGVMGERAIAEVESGATRREAAEEFAVSASTVVIWVKCFRQTGRCAAKPRGGSISPLEKHANFLLGLIEKQPDLTLDEVVLAMGNHKIPGSRTAVWRFFKRHKITFKKKPTRSGAGARGRGAGAPALDARTGHV